VRDRFRDREREERGIETERQKDREDRWEGKREEMLS